ncbi:hypothetical protein OF117_20990 [Geodermatophilus sp. YIM 151500]|uniref:DoxX family protein n=1 Tax=Geodermatophilus sp. YIM 151500 TaxID=2984531 RepID=UPI0021E3CB56|nr:hypothetical protein [Geodermatophilus sp. YIM 151500]MCV2491828.1 hypothetical protein [Geodermatophilus sp. YIM 151500]
MVFMALLAVGTLLAAAVPTASGRRPLRDAARIGMAGAMATAGVTHWLMPAPFVQHVPPFVPAPEAVVLLTGVVEVALGAALVGPEAWRRRVGMALAAYLVAVFPANLYVAVAGIDVEGQPDGWFSWLRLPLQAVFIGWALWSTARSTGTAGRRRPDPYRAAATPAAATPVATSPAAATGRHGRPRG